VDGQEVTGGDEVADDAPVGEVASDSPGRTPETPGVEIVADRRVIRLRTFPGVASSVAAARNFATQSLVDLPSDTRDEVRLMVSELASNAIEHVMTSFDLTIQRTSQEVRVEVTDYGGGTPAMQSVGPDALRGRGLKIVDTLATYWGVEQRSESAKTVWFTLILTPALSG
jgi:anti-sigma regulatory factor (Ser/Thr protein kinase)